MRIFKIAFFANPFRLRRNSFVFPTLLFMSIFCFATSVSGQWEVDKRLTLYPSYWDYGNDNNAWTIAVRDTMVHIVWEHRPSLSGIGELYYIRSINSGATFDPDKQLTPQNSHYPSIAVRDSIIHVVWYEILGISNTEIYYKRSIDNGVNWGATMGLTNDPAYSQNSSIAVQDSIVHVVWTDGRDGNYEVYYKRSIDNGANWGQDMRLTNNSASSKYPSIAVHDSIVHVVWYDDRDGNKEVYYKPSIDNGVNWGADKRLTNNPDNSSYPSIAVRYSIVHVVWYDDRDGNEEIYYKRSIDNGVNWEPDMRLTNDPASSEHPSIAVWDSAVHVVWTDNRDGNEEIYYKHSIDDGILWYADERLTNAPNNSEFVSVACWDCSYNYDVHVAWTDSRDNPTMEIYYKRHKCEGAGVEEKLKVKSEKLKVKSVLGMGRVDFSIYLLHEESVELKVYNISGRLVDVREFTLSEGNNEFSWHNDKSGIYFFRFKIGEAEIFEKAIIF